MAGEEGAAGVEAGAGEVSWSGRRSWGAVDVSGEACGEIGVRRGGPVRGYTAGAEQLILGPRDGGGRPTRCQASGVSLGFHWLPQAQALAFGPVT